MDRIIVCAFTGATFLHTAFPNGTTPYEYVVARVDELRKVDGVDGSVIYLTSDAEPYVPPELPTEWQHLHIPARDASSVYLHLAETLDQDVENLIFLRSDAPFVKVELATELLELHRSTWCDYTFADGFPRGYAVEVLRREVLPVLGALAQPVQQGWLPGALFETLQKDINAFDIETEAAPEDYTLFRASLTADSRQNYILCRRLAEREDAGESILETLRTRPEIRRTLPYYYQVQITTEMPHRPSYLPWSDDRWRADPPGRGTHMDLPLWQQTVRRITEETPQAVVAVGYRGEPALHPDITRILGSFSPYPGISLYVETSGIGWTEEARQALLTESVAAVIVELDAGKEETYKAVRGGDGTHYREATEFIEWLARNKAGSVYVQATRMVENEWELQELYKRWNGTKGVSVIIQKYNSFAGRLPDRKVADLTPLERIPCRHLERDMVILVDGTVPMCFQDLDGSHVRGTVSSRTINELFVAGEKDFSLHVEKNYPSLCEHCDEYYTFNA